MSIPSADLRKAVRSGSTLREIAAQFGCSVGTVAREAERHQIRIPANRIDVPGSKLATSIRLSHELALRLAARANIEAQAMADIRNGMSLSRAASKYHIGHRQLRRVIESENA